MKTQTLLLSAAAFGLGWWLFNKKETPTNYLPEPPAEQPGGYVILPNGLPGKTGPVFSSGNTNAGNVFMQTPGISGLSTF